MHFEEKEVMHLLVLDFVEELQEVDVDAFFDDQQDCLGQVYGFV